MTRRTYGPRLTKLLLASFPSINRKKKITLQTSSRPSYGAEFIQTSPEHPDSMNDSAVFSFALETLSWELCTLLWWTHTIVCLHTNCITCAGILRKNESSNPNMPCFSCHTLIRWGIWADSVSKPPIYWGWEAKRRVTTLPLIYMNATWMWSTTTGATVVWMLPCPASERDCSYLSGVSTYQLALTEVVRIYSIIPLGYQLYTPPPGSSIFNPQRAGMTAGFHSTQAGATPDSTCLISSYWCPITYKVYFLYTL